MPIDHDKRARMAWPLLALRAASRSPPCTYGEFCGEIGVHWRSAPCFLSVIRRYCGANELPPLQMLVVNSSTRLPGQGCAGAPRTHSEYQDVLRSIYAHQWSVDAPF